jgi:aspartyl-tRNA(Asn)/glutamyl-tRNA(Gln) amidotransferase subunit C
LRKADNPLARIPGRGKPLKASASRPHRTWQDHRVAISRDEVLHVARLARLALTDDEVDRLTTELDAILEAVGVVAELDLADVPPTAHPLDVVNVWDEDEPHESLALDDVFANAPARDGDLFRVPPTV